MSSDLDLQILDEMPQSCEGCGKCCEQNGSPVLLYQSYPETEQAHPYRPEGLPEKLIDEIDANFKGLFRGQESQSACLWYDVKKKRCRHYQWRPQVCREFEIRSVACLSARMN